MLGKALGYQAKLQKHLAAGNVERLRDYLAHIVLEWPDLEKCPIDRGILKRAKTLVERDFWFNPNAKTLAEVFVRKPVTFTT